MSEGTPVKTDGGSTITSVYQTVARNLLAVLFDEECCADLRGKENGIRIKEALRLLGDPKVDWEQKS